MQLICCLIRLLAGFSLQPSAIGKHRKDSDRNDEDNAEYQYHTRVMSGPVGPFDDGMKSSGRGSGRISSSDQIDRSHFVIGCPIVRRQEADVAML